MTYQSAIYINEENTSVKATLTDGTILSIPVNDGNRHYKDLVDSGLTIDPFPTKSLTEYKQEKKNYIIATLNALTQPILNAYPQAEKEAWIAKEVEAKTFLDIDESSQTVTDAPFIAQIVNGQFPDATEAEILTHIRDKATVILNKASEWRGLSAYVEAVRSKTDIAIDGGADIAAVDAIITAVETEIEAFRVLKGL